MTDKIVLHRPPHTLTVTRDNGRLSLSISGGDNVTEAEFETISAFAGEGEEAERFLGKIRERMGR